ncbi:MAG: hypothetical protein A3F33_01610 [Candidatus Woykebacteria bacterium RIFCSPHIGHO2_12_FULL_43_10]|uniref:DUF2029 domain-containing protein n=2 Tax=Candidatus Woykeibacteriota TaxID=1817899 RepID=A0A1G1WV57_9BACT|nr:MAG: hypothetical protein A2802_01810 [Candidatus Woykebacteria bacterium RIFCSPHIGHO2_01_FULL_43_29]OGY29512.1 MAG: hypothetical protein A3F33_01610 [Candidatus Woykebacteria bacterium RIFCSPHIGHO2_12_FULL_43_10]OGY29611.1 MAG: hypothetical protein A3J50_00150 [Candidatus Woykebacteria bacterium RIFCSPHIGHO2_02_FULL_43_16b]OGY31626.1 MAG: hypothetical protein A3A61_00340 [Candidatus Woykebacteria bacterium RIFCSPLOWO2_01_FULL_43_14]
MKNLNSFVKLALLGLIIRLLTAFFTHPWDIQTFYNFFVDLARNISPYDTMMYLSSFARAYVGPGWDYNFEYYAYPPLPILIYYLPAKLFGLLHPNIDYSFVVSHAAPVLKVPWDFNFFFKIPLIISDIAIAWLLSKRLDLYRAKSFLLNPYVILISASWMFDSLMTLFLLLSMLAIEKNKLNWGSFFLGLGAMTKFVPWFVFPAILIYLIKKETSLRSFLAFIAVFVATNLVFILPFFDGFLFVLDFHASRVGSGLTPQLLVQQLPYYLSNNYINFDTLLPIYHFVIPNVSLMIFIIGMLFIYYLIAKRSFSLNQTVLVSLLGYLIFNKIVNEQYIFVMLPFLLIDLKEHPGKIKNLLYTLLWVLPLCFAIVNVPITGFALPMLRSFNLDTSSVLLYSDWVSGASIRLWYLRLVALTFTAVTLCYTWYTVKKANNETS